jgi:hypothetical protein
VAAFVCDTFSSEKGIVSKFGVPQEASFRSNEKAELID